MAFSTKDQLRMEIIIKIEKQYDTFQRYGVASLLISKEEAKIITDALKILPGSGMTDTDLDNMSKEFGLKVINNDDIRLKGGCF